MMPVELVERAICIRGKSITVSVYDYICDECGSHHVISDTPPPPYGTHEDRPTADLGWSLTYPDDEEGKAFCPTCTTVRRNKALAALKDNQP